MSELRPSDLTAQDIVAAPRAEIGTLLAIMAALRHPETGCPWDIEQTFQTIAPYTIEEAYEVGDAILRSDLADLKEELGDLLLQVVYHARIAEELGSFSFADIVDGISSKMIRRHPHVFGSEEERRAGVEPGFWERIKAEEKAGRAAERERFGPGSDNNAAQDDTDGLLDEVPANLPPLAQAVKLQRKAARVGFDWPSLTPVLAKLREELGELDEAVASANQQAVADEFGDLLFVMANVARHLKVDPAAALQTTNVKFRRRFARVEALLAASGRSAEEATLEEMDTLWDQAKLEERTTDNG